MHALEIHPPMPMAIKDTVVSFIDLVVFMGPQTGIGIGIHPGVHGRGH